jgi:hypothetical protein
MTIASKESKPSKKPGIIGLINAKILELDKNAPQFGTVGIELVLHDGEVVRIITKIDQQEQIIA